MKRRPKFRKFINIQKLKLHDWLQRISHVEWGKGNVWILPSFWCTLVVHTTKNEMDHNMECLSEGCAIMQELSWKLHIMGGLRKGLVSAGHLSDKPREIIFFARSNQNSIIYHNQDKLVWREMLISFWPENNKSLEGIFMTGPPCTLASEMPSDTNPWRSYQGQGLSSTGYPV